LLVVLKAITQLLSCDALLVGFSDRMTDNS
jgi:hypothetical protein